jgi:hypothetical protein
MRKTMIVALARKLLVALWSFVRTGEVPSGIVLWPIAWAAWQPQVPESRSVGDELVGRERFGREALFLEELVIGPRLVIRFEC